MKLWQLLNVLNPEIDVTFEILESTYPTSILAKDIPTKYPTALGYRVVRVDPGVSTYNGEELLTLCVEVTSGRKPTKEKLEGKV